MPFLDVTDVSFYCLMLIVPPEMLLRSPGVHDLIAALAQSLLMAFKHEV